MQVTRPLDNDVTGVVDKEHTYLYSKEVPVHLMTLF